uniref:Uncharacterized protein n=1 Tax=Tetranychus urticae TaxID=32264 RepID=T1L6A0_TETUR
MNNQQQKLKQSGQGDKRQRESPSSSSVGNAPDNRPSKMVKISKNQTLNSQHKNLQIQQQQQQQQQQKHQHQQLQQQYKLHQQMIGNHDQLTNDSVFNVKALIADEKEAALNKNSPQTGFTLKSMPVDLRNPRNMNKSGGLHAIPSGPFQHFHHLNFANPSSVLVPIATGSSDIHLDLIMSRHFLIWHI